MTTDRIPIYDNALRDGLRNSGIEVALEDKASALRQLERLGVDAVDVSFDGPTQVETMKLLATEVSGPVLFALGHVNRRDAFAGVRTGQSLDQLEPTARLRQIRRPAGNNLANRSHRA